MYVPCLFSEVIIVLEALKVSPLNKASWCCSWTSGWKGTLFLHKHHCAVHNSGVEIGNLIEKTRLWNIIVLYIVTCVYCKRNKANTVQTHVGFLCLIRCIQQRRFCPRHWDMSLWCLVQGSGSQLEGTGWVAPLIGSFFCLAISQNVVWFSQHSGRQA